MGARNMSDPAPIPIDAQIIEVEKTVRDRARRYPYMIERGSLLPDTADRKLNTMRAVQSTLTWLADNAGWIRLEFARREKQAALSDAEAGELAALKNDPTVKAALDEFPSAKVLAITPLSKAKSEDAA